MPALLDNSAVFTIYCIQEFLSAHGIGKHTIPDNYTESDKDITAAGVQIVSTMNW